jgi:hypothetical protein
LGQIRSHGVGSGQIRLGQDRLGQIGSHWVGSGQIRLGQDRVSQIGSRRVRLDWIRLDQVRLGQNGLDQNCVSRSWAAHYNKQLKPGKVSYICQESQFLLWLVFPRYFPRQNEIMPGPGDMVSSK